MMVRRSISTVVLGLAVLLMACKAEETPPLNTGRANPTAEPTVTTPTTTGGAPAAEPPSDCPRPVGKSDYIVVSPDPVQVCQDTLTAVRVCWRTGRSAAEVRVGTPDGALFAAGPIGTSLTGKWATDGMVFYLQDRSSGRALNAGGTIATATVHFTKDNCK